MTLMLLKPPVRRVDIAKATGGRRTLGIPTVVDRIAQMVVKLGIEPELEQHFHPNSYGYRPGKSAHEALRQTRRRCDQRAWVLELSRYTQPEKDLQLLLKQLHLDLPEQPPPKIRPTSL